MIRRCPWVLVDNDLYREYHDREWGRPQYDEYKLFEHLVLDTHQAGLSWLTILQKRENYRKAFDNFSPHKIALYNENKIDELMRNKGIVRNRLKIMSTVKNAAAFLEIQKEYGSFSDYIWSFVGGRTIINEWTNINSIPVKTKESIDMSNDMKKKGFKFVGPVSCYAFMQASGLVLDHIKDCFLYQEILNEIKTS